MTQHSKLKDNQKGLYIQKEDITCMGHYIPLEEALDFEVSKVGQKAKLLAAQKDQMPFSLLLTSEVFDKFVEYNNLQPNLRIALNDTELNTNSIIVAFQELTNEFKKARFPMEIQESLRECFDLLCLDTSKLDLLGEQKKKHTVLGILRSIEGEDKDHLSYKLFTTKDSFDHFLDTLKTAYLSLFTPSAIVKRLGQEPPKPALVLMRLPNITTCFESIANPATKDIKVRSYAGFLDYSGEVTRDTFFVGYDFLKIQRTKIAPQGKVSIFDLQTNKVITKPFPKQTSAQSAPDPVILEVARLTKRLSQDKTGQAMFVKDSDGKISLIDMFVQEPAQKILMTETDHLDTFRTNIIRFLENYEHEPEYKETINILLRSLKTDKSTQSLNQGVLLAKELIEKLH